MDLHIESNKKYEDGHVCRSAHVTEDEIKAAFVKAFNEVLTEKDEVINNAKITRNLICNTSDLEKERMQLEDERGIVSDMLQRLIAENARVLQDQDDYNARYEEIMERYEALNARLKAVQEKIDEKTLADAKMSSFINLLQKQAGFLDKFYKDVWSSTIDFVEVDNQKKMKFVFLGGLEICI